MDFTKAFTIFDDLKAEVMKLQDQLRKSEEEKQEMRVCLEVYRIKVAELQQELRAARTMVSVPVPDEECSTTRMISQIRAKISAALSDDASSVSQDMTGGNTDCDLAVPEVSLMVASTAPHITEAMTEEKLIVEQTTPIMLDVTSESKTDLITENTSVETASGCEASPSITSAAAKREEVVGPSPLSPVFACCDFRYKGQTNIPGYTVIPTQDEEDTANLANVTLDFLHPVEPEKVVIPFDTFHIRDQIVKTEHIFTSTCVLTNVPIQHFGRILGKGCQNVTELRGKFGVQISVLRPKTKSPEERLKVKISSGTAARRHEAADHLMGQLPVQVEVFFGAGFLTWTKKSFAHKHYPHVRIEDIGQGQYILHGKLEDCRQIFEDFKSGRA